MTFISQIIKAAKGEVFRYGGHSFDIEEADKIVAKKKPTKMMPHPGWILPFIHIDKEYAEKLTDADLERPVIFAPLWSRSGDALGNILIDGYHRVYKALHSTPPKEVNVVILTKPETKRIMDKD